MNQMTIGKKIGFFFLGLFPFLIALGLQLGFSIYFMMIYLLLAMMQPNFQQIEVNSQEYVEAVEQIGMEFQASPAMAFGTFAIYIIYLTLYGLWYYFIFCDKSKTQTQNTAPQKGIRCFLMPNRFFPIVFMGITLQISLDMVLDLTLPLFPQLCEEYMTLMETASTPSLFMVISISLLAPVGEELIFRGITRKIFQRILPWQIALILQALLFGIYHMNLVQGVYTFLIGLMMGYLAHRFDSVLPGILLHMSLNCSSYFVFLFLPESLFEKPLAMIGTSIVTFVITFAMLYFSIKTPVAKRAKNKQPEA